MSEKTLSFHHDHLHHHLSWQIEARRFSSLQAEISITKLIFFPTHSNTGSEMSDIVKSDNAAPLCTEKHNTPPWPHLDNALVLFSEMHAKVTLQ